MAGGLVSPVLVGRQAESRSLSGALGRALTGQQVTALVGGETGVGKSRLVHELIDEARGAGPRVLVGGCVELDGGGIPFAPVVEMIGSLAAELPTAELDAVLGTARGELGRLVPELEDDQPTAPAGERDASRLLELTVRSDELHRAHPFRRMAARWEQQRIVDRLELDRLERRGVAAQVEAILGERPDADLIEFVAERSEGIPLFVEELLAVSGLFVLAVAALLLHRPLASGRERAVSVPA